MKMHTLKNDLEKKSLLQIKLNGPTLLLLY